MAMYQESRTEETITDNEEEEYTESRNDGKEKGGIRSWVNIYMIPVKLTYFLWGCTNGSYPIYLNPFLTSSGISKTKAGFITGIIFAVSSVAAPLWGMLSDYTGRRKLILVLICVTAAASMFTLPIAESKLVTTSHNVNSTCSAVRSTNSTNTFNSTFHWLVSAPFNTTFDNSTYYDTHYTTNITRPCANRTIPVRKRCTFRMCRGDLSTLFYALLFIVSIGAVFFAPLPSYVDAIAFNVIKTSPVKASYGGQRIFGTLGGIGTMYLTGFLIDRYQFDGMSIYSIPFFVFVPISLMLIPCGCFISLQYERSLTRQRTDSQENGTTKESKKVTGSKDSMKVRSIKSELLSMLKRSDVIVFMMTALMSGMAINLFIFFTEMLIDDVLDVSKRDASFIFIVHNLTSILTFPFAGKLVRLLGGAKPTMVIGMFSHCIRHLVMSYTRTYWLMLSIQCLHCLDFALMLCAMMEYIHDSSPTEIKMTMTLIFRTIKYSVGTFLVNVLGGLVYQNFGGRTLFRWNGILCGVWGLFLCVYYGVGLYNKQKVGARTKEELLADAEVADSLTLDIGALKDKLKETDV